MSFFFYLAERITMTRGNTAARELFSVLGLNYVTITISVETVKKIKALINWITF